MLVIAGPDSNGYRTQVEQSVRHHHLNDHVLFTGMLVGDQRLAALRGARFFVLPSRQENFGLAVVEAMACGCPVIVSDRVNIYREIREAGAGSAVSLDGGSLERELVRWLANPSLSRAAAGRAARFVRAHYDQDRIANGWGDHYDYLIRSRRPEHQWVAPEPTLVHTGSI
jgi:glycosyltransferase involved in cell wall biosynthesis